jgi:hypothetical protein
MSTARCGSGGSSGRAAGAGLAAAGAADPEVRGLNKSPSVNLPGDADAVGSGQPAPIALAKPHRQSFRRRRFRASVAAGERVDSRIRRTHLLFQILGDALGGVADLLEDIRQGRHHFRESVHCHLQPK